jgi:hypothetical protein
MGAKSTVSPDITARDVQGEGPADRALDLLLSPTEWRVLLALHTVGPSASSSAVAQALQPQRLPKNHVEALLERLHARNFVLRAPKGGWEPGETSLEELLRPQIEAFFRTFLVGVPEGFDVLRKVLDEWRPGELETSAQVEHG